MSILKQSVNLKILERELEDAIKEDELYKLQNDAKIRAIEQRVPTYEHFRSMVQAAHLKPLERSEIKKMPEVSWNHCCNKKDEAILQDREISSQSQKFMFDDSLNPQNSTEFLNIWKSIAADEQKFQYLLTLRHQLKNKYFRVEVPTAFIEDFIQLSLTNCCGEKISQIVDILQIFSECNRFTLSLSMISKSKSSPLFLLFKEMMSKAQTVDQTNKIENLMEKYCISF